MGTVCSATDNVSLDGGSSDVVSSSRTSKAAKSRKSDQVTLVSVKGKTPPDILFGTSAATNTVTAAANETYRGNDGYENDTGERRISESFLKYQMMPEETEGDRNYKVSGETSPLISSVSVTSEKTQETTVIGDIGSVVSGKDDVQLNQDTVVGEDAKINDQPDASSDAIIPTLEGDSCTDGATKQESFQDANSDLIIDSTDPSSSNPPGETVMASFGSLAIGKPAPAFECQAVVNGDFKPVKLSDYRGKYVVLFFYPLDFTFVCPTEIIAFSDRSEEFRAIGCEVLACSTDSVYSHLAWVDTPRKQGGLGPMKIPLLADKTQELSKKYGCLKEDEGIAFRALYIIDDKGNLRQITINDLPVGRSVDETLRLVQAFQFTDKHGEVCPAGWKPGKETMKPDPKESQKYFKSVN